MEHTPIESGQSGKPSVGARLEQHVRVAFTTAGVLMLPGLPVGAAALLSEDALYLISALGGLAFVAVAVGLLGLISKLGDPRRVILALSVIGGISAMVIAVVGVVALVARSSIDGRTFTTIVTVILLSGLVLFVALMAAMTAVGSAIKRAGLGRPTTGSFLITGGLLSLAVPLVIVLPLLSVAWAVIFFAVGSAFPRNEPVPAQADPGELG